MEARRPLLTEALCQPVCYVGTKRQSSLRAKLQSCLDVVVTPLIEHETTKIRMTTVKTIVAGRDCVELKTTAMYGCPVEELVTASISPRQNIRVTVILISLICRKKTCYGFLPTITNAVT